MAIFPVLKILLLLVENLPLPVSMSVPKLVAVHPNVLQPLPLRLLLLLQHHHMLMAMTLLMRKMPMVHNQTKVLQHCHLPPNQRLHSQIHLARFVAGAFPLKMLPGGVPLRAHYTIYYIVRHPLLCAC